MKEQEIMRVQTDQVDGYYLEVQNNRGISIKLLIQEKQSGRIFEADMAYTQLGQIPKVAFKSIDDLYNHIRQCVDSQINRLRILPTGILQVGLNHEKGIIMIPISTVQKEQTPFERVSRQISQLSKGFDQLTRELRNHKQQLPEKITQHIQKKTFETQYETLTSIEGKFLAEKLRNEQKEQFIGLKRQLLAQADQTKREDQGWKQQLVSKIQEDWQNKLAEIEKKNIEALEETKNNWERVQMEQQKRIDHVNKQIEILSKGLSTIDSLETTQKITNILSPQCGAIKNSPVANQDKHEQIKRDVAKISLSELSTVNAIRVSFQADTQFNVFKGSWKIDKESKIIEKIRAHSSSVVSKNELPTTDIYYFEVRCISVHWPQFGIITHQGRQKHYFDPKQDQYIIIKGFGVCSQIYESGKVKQIVNWSVQDGDLVSVLVDKQKGQIRWLVNDHSMASAKLSQCFQTKPTYAFLNQDSSGVGYKYQCIQ